MSSLADLQRDFRRVVTSADEHDPGMFAAGMGDPMRRLSIYRDAYRSRLTEALRANYPVLARVLGDEAFAELALQYIDARPSRRASIRWFGDELPEFVGGAGHTLSHPALCDLIRLEWAAGHAFDAADGPVATREALLQRPPHTWPDLRLTFHPSVRMLDLEWSVEAIWQQLSQDIDEAAERDIPEPQQHTHSTVIWRKDLTPRLRSLDTAEAACLHSAMQGAPFAQWCEIAAAMLEPGDAAKIVVSWVCWWIDDEMLSFG